MSDNLKLTPVYMYPVGAGEEGKVVDERFVQLESLGFYFEVTDGMPTLPLKSHGAIWHAGWDIPTNWAVDASGQVWMDNAHGATLRKVTPESLLERAKTDDDRSEITKALSLSPPMPEWAEKALAAGWKPPEGWKPE